MCKNVSQLRERLSNERCRAGTPTGDPSQTVALKARKEWWLCRGSGCARAYRHTHIRTPLVHAVVPPAAVGTVPKTGRGLAAQQHLASGTASWVPGWSLREPRSRSTGRLTTKIKTKKASANAIANGAKIVIK